MCGPGREPTLVAKRPVFQALLVELMSTQTLDVTCTYGQHLGGDHVNNDPSRHIENGIEAPHNLHCGWY